MDLSRFYNDFIATRDSVAAQKGQFIVDFLARYQQVADRVVASVQREVGAQGKLRSKCSINYAVIQQILDSNPAAMAFDPARANEELALLPASPLDLDSIVTNLPGTWYLQTGSMAEDANLSYRTSDGKFSCPAGAVVAGGTGATTGSGSGGRRRAWTICTGLASIWPFMPASAPASGSCGCVRICRTTSMPSLTRPNTA